MTASDVRRSCSGVLRSAAASSSWMPIATGAGLLIALTLVAYIPALSGGFVFDDNEFVTDNVPLRTLAGLWRIWFELGATPHQYYPLTFSSFWVEYHLWGPQPMGYHLVNVLLHGLNAALLWRVLSHLRLPGAWVAAAVFALHPVHVESVAWITERKNVLSGFFALAGFLVYLRDTPAPGAARTVRTPSTEIAAVALFVAAMLSKTATCTLPAVLLLVAWCRRQLDRRTLRTVGLLFAVSIVLAALTVWMERYHAGAEGEEWALSLVERGLIAGRALWFYPRMLLLPSPLSFMYPRWSIDAQSWWQYLFPLAVIAVLAGLWYGRRRFGSTPLVGILCYVILLSPVLGFFDLYFMRYAFVADHFVYLPSVPLIALSVAAASALAHRLGGIARRAAPVACACVLLVFAVLTAQRCGIYRTPRTLWADTVARNPESYIAHNNLGIALEQDGDADAALVQYQDAVRLKPTYPEAYLNIGNLLQASGRPEDAAKLYTAALRLQPTYVLARYNLGLALAAQERTAEAIAQFEEALRQQPDSAKIHYNLAVGLLRLERTDEAIAHLEQAVHLQPDLAEAHTILGSVLASQGKTATAIAHLEQAAQLQPTYAAYSALATALAADGQSARAIAALQTALQLNPTVTEGRERLEQLQREQLNDPEHHPS